jgi:hypothetical protein
VEYSPAAVGSHTFGASSDTYIDYTVGTGITYTAVTNGAASPSLAANSIRLAKVVTGASTIGSITQSGGDTLGNLIYPFGPASTSILQVPAFFSVYRSAALTLTPTAVVIFDTKDYDYGNNYNTTTGEFVATIPGLYMFTSTLSVLPDSSTHYSAVGIYKNGSPANQGKRGSQLSGTTNAIAPTITVPVPMNVGDYVQVNYLGNGSSIGFNVGNADEVTHFEGYLVGRG